MNEPRALTVLQVVPELKAGGAERTTVEIARAIVEAGGRALVASEGGRLELELAAAGAELFRLPAKSKNPAVIWANRGRLIDLIRRFDVDIIHARSRAPAWSALWAARATGARYVATYHGVYSAKSRLKRFYNSVMARADVVIANSDFTRAHVASEHGTPPERLVAIPRGADLDRFDPAAITEARLEAARRHWGLKPADNSKVVLLPGRLTAWKGQREMVEAVRLLVETRRATGQKTDFLLILMGDAQGRDGYAQSLDDAVREAGLSEVARICGHYADMPAAYRAADIVVSASTRPEAFGRVAVEAQAMERPVVATDHGGSRETVVDGETGVLVAPRDPQDLARGVLTLLDMDAADRARMGAAGRRRVEERFSTAAMAAATLEVYRSATSGPRSPGLKG